MDLLTAMIHLLADQLEHPIGVGNIASHGAWLAETPPGEVSSDFKGRMNGLLITSGHTTGSKSLRPRYGI